MSTNVNSISDYATAGYPAVAISTSDEDRTVQSIVAAMPEHHAYLINVSGRLLDLHPSSRVEPQQSNYQSAFAKLQTARRDDPMLLIVLDYQHIIRNAAAYRNLRDALGVVKATGSMIALVAPSWNLPAELEHDIPVLHDGLPSRQELEASLDVCVRETRASISAETRAAILNAASGLTLAEAEGAIALSFDGTVFHPERVSEEKMKLVRQSGYLEVSEPMAIDQLGGLGNLREYFENEVLPVASDIDLAVRALMLVGVSGTGKSLASKVAASLLRWPIVRCDIGDHIAILVVVGIRQKPRSLIGPCQRLLVMPGPQSTHVAHERLVAQRLTGQEVLIEPAAIGGGAMVLDHGFRDGLVELLGRPCRDAKGHQQG